MIEPYFHQSVSDEYALSRAILLYEGRGTHLRSGNAPSGFATIHQVEPTDGDGPPRLAAGTLISRETASAALRAIGDRTSFAYLPPHVVAASTHGLAWHAPATNRPLFFATGRDALLDDTISGGVYPHPPLLFIARPNGLSVFALDSDERPAPDTPLHHGPYMNLYRDGRVCVGSMPLPETLDPSDTRAYEDAFFRSRFTHANQPRLLAPSWGGSYGEAWLHAHEHDRFPTEHLVPTGTTLAEELTR